MACISLTCKLQLLKMMPLQANQFFIKLSPY